MQNNLYYNEIEELLLLYKSKESVEKLIPWIHQSIAEGDLDATLFYGYYLINEGIDKELGKLLFKVVSLAGIHRLNVYLVYVNHLLMLDTMNKALNDD